MVDSLSEREGHVKVSLQQKLKDHSKPERENSYMGYSEYSLAPKQVSKPQVSNLRGAMD